MANWTVYEQCAFALFMFAMGFVFGYVAAQSGQRVASTSDDLWNEKLILKIVEELNIMFASAQCEVDESDGITGYRVKTGALHRIVGALAGIGQSVSIPANMPVVGQRAAVAEDARDAAYWRAAVDHHIVPKYVGDLTVEEYLDEEIAAPTHHTDQS